MYIFQSVIVVGVLNVKSLCKTVAEVVAGAGLECLAVVHQGFDGVCCLSAGKFFLISLPAFDDRYRKHLLAEIRIYVQHLDGARLSFFCCSVRGVTFLPEKFP